jgi:LmbE family N-acetylglucosaminyl deacetylase
MRAVLIISPHFDDAILSAGQFIAGRPDCVVATVLAGTPPTKSVLTNYDAVTGFKSATEAMDARRAEDLEAMSVLQAKARHLDSVDSQYGCRFEPEEVIAQLRELIDELDPEFIVGPLGLVHPDHEAVRDALLEAVKASEALWLYEDLPARVQHPESVHKAVGNLAKRGISLELGFIGTGAVARKMDALWSYRSQMGLPEFANRHELLVSERFWRVSKAVTPEEQA